MVPIITVMPENIEQQSNRTDLQSDKILDSLPIGIIAFDSEMKIVKANQQAIELIELSEYIDKSLAKGTDDIIWQGSQWKGPPVYLHPGGQVGDHLSLS